MEFDIRIYFLLFLIYSVIGWIMEVTLSFIENHKFINRGFLIGPYCPIYGTGAIIITLLLNRYVDDWIVLFIMSILICGVLEYITSYLMEKIFKARWWDYSNMKFNINGRICLETIIPFGLLGLLIMYITNPFFFSLLQQIPNVWLTVLSIFFAIVFIIDNIISFNVIANVRIATKKISKENIKDNTEEITQKVKEILLSKSKLHKRLLNAFPKIESLKSKIKEKAKNTINKAKNKEEEKPKENE